MANEYSILRQIPPPQQVADTQLQFKALAFKQKKFDEGLDEFKSNFTAVANIDIARESGQKYLQQRLNTITSQLNGNVYDFSDSSVSNNLVGTIGQTFDNTVVQEVVDTRQLRKAQTEIAELKEANDGRYSQANHWDAMQGVADWMQSDNLGTRLPNIDYKNFVDIDARKKEFFDTMYENSETTIDMPIQREIVNKDGSITYEDTGRTKKVTKIGLSPADVERAFEASLTPDEISQMGINGRFTYQGVPASELQGEYDRLYSGRINEIESLRQSAISSGNKSLEKTYDTKIRNLKKQRDNVSALPENLRHNKQSEFLMKQGYLGSFQTQYKQRVAETIYGKDDVFFDRLKAEDAERGRDIQDKEFNLKQDKFDFEKQEAKRKANSSTDGTGGINGLILPTTDNLQGDANNISAQSLEKSKTDEFRGQLRASTQNLLSTLHPQMVSTIKDVISTEQLRNGGKSADVIAAQAMDELISSMTDEQWKSLDDQQQADVTQWEWDRQNTESIVTHKAKEDKVKATNFTKSVSESALNVIFLEAKTEEVISQGGKTAGTKVQRTVVGARGERDGYNKVLSDINSTVFLVGNELSPTGSQVNDKNRNTFFVDNPKAQSDFNKVALSDVIVNSSVGEREVAMKGLAAEFGVEMKQMPTVQKTTGGVTITGGDDKINKLLTSANSNLIKGNLFTNNGANLLNINTLPFQVAQQFIRNDPTITDDNRFANTLSQQEGVNERRRTDRLVETRVGAKSLVVGNDISDPLNQYIAAVALDANTVFSNGDDVGLSQGNGDAERLREIQGAIKDDLIVDGKNKPLIQLGEKTSTIKVTGGGKIGAVTMEVPTSDELIAIYNQKTGLKITREMLKDDGASLKFDRSFKKRVRPVRKVDLINKKKQYENGGVQLFDQRGNETTDGLKVTPEGGTKLMVNTYRNSLKEGDGERISTILQGSDAFNFDVALKDGELLLNVNIKERNSDGEFEDRTVFSNSRDLRELTRLEQDKAYEAVTLRYNAAPTIAVWDMVSKIIADSASDNTVPTISLDNLSELVRTNTFRSNRTSR